MKKIILITFILLTPIIYFLSFSDNKEADITDSPTTEITDIENENKDIKLSEEINKTKSIEKNTKPTQVDITTLKEHISEEIKDSEFLEIIVDFDIDNEEIMKRFSPTQIYQNSKSVVRDLSECLKEFCSMKPDEDGFFDPANTVADKVLNKNLELLIMVAKEGNLFEFNINDLDFEKIFTSQNVKVQKNGLELYLQYKNESSDISKLFDYAHNFKDESKAIFYASLDEATKQSADVRNTYLEAINNDLANSKGLERVEIIKNLKNFNLDKEELPTAISNLCNETSSAINNVIDVTLKELNINKSAFCK